MGGRQNVVDAVATGAVGHPQRTGPRGQTMIALLIAPHAVRRKIVPLIETLVRMATGAGLLGNIGHIDRRISLRRRENRMFPMTIATHGGSGDPARYRLSMHTLLIGAIDSLMAGTACF